MARSRLILLAQRQRDLLSILEPSGKVRSGIFRELHDVTLHTRSFGTDLGGVCRRDALTLRYTAGPGEASNRKPVHPYSIEARPTFHIVRLPSITKAMGEPDPSHVAQPACVDLGKTWLRQARAEGRDLNEWDKADWVEAKDAFQAVQAGFMLDMALAAVRAHGLKPEACPYITESDKRSCEQIIPAAGGVSDMGSIASCPANAGQICYEIDFPTETKLTVGASSTVIVRHGRSAGRAIHIIIGNPLPLGVDM